MSKSRQTKDVLSAQTSQLSFSFSCLFLFFFLSDISIIAAWFIDNIPQNWRLSQNLVKLRWFLVFVSRIAHRQMLQIDVNYFFNLLEGLTWLHWRLSKAGIIYIYIFLVSSCVCIHFMFFFLFVLYSIFLQGNLLQTCHSFRFYLNHSDFFPEI